MSKRTLLLSVVASLTIVAPCIAQSGIGAQNTNPRQIMEEVQRRARSDSQHYEGTLEVIGGGNRIATKRWIYDRLGSFGASKAVLRFVAPPEVKGVGLLILNHPERASDQWMWRPNIGREQRIAFQDRSTRFFGTDFSFEDLEERDVGQYDFKFESDDAAAWKLESTPRKKSQYTHSYLWIGKNNYTVTRIELYTKMGLMRAIDYRDFEQVQGVWTPRTTEIGDVTRNSRTILKYDKLEYNVPLKDADFTLDALRRGT
ncbi:MAG TPA: outer membrane lipoprotein-sorting protein [Bryobacteraceae bacterium]|nr:outer membrane lipoprotein-sorting protein [Bryobacteraceae bacterium]